MKYVEVTVRLTALEARAFTAPIPQVNSRGTWKLEPQRVRAHKRARGKFWSAVRAKLREQA